MSVYRSIILSALIHALLFASALAFARIGSGLIETGENAVVVSLVTSGATSGARTGVRRQDVEQQPVQQQEVAAPVERSDVARTDALPEVNAAQADAAKAPDAVQGEGSGEMHARSAVSGNGSGADQEIGFITPEQWAVIEASIERNKTYPRLARERAIQGTVRLRFKIAPSGDVQKLEVIESSGSDILDSASIRTVYRSTPLPYVRGWGEKTFVYVLK